MEERTSKIDIVDMILGLEAGNLLIENMQDWITVKNLALQLSSSQGFYSRLFNHMEEMENTQDMENIFPIIF